jgi:glucans biosynthesis protein
MQRRRFLLNGATFLATAATLDTPARGADPKAPPGDPKTLGGPEPFDYARLKGRARTLADAPYKAPGGKVPTAIAKLVWDQWLSMS